ncbi:MAG TPA: hypothetical protein VK646_01875 [Actinomycetota bacterium]|nr:hypothetical protein [Actinomycetota bacterium]
MNFWAQSRQPHGAGRLPGRVPSGGTKIAPGVGVILEGDNWDPNVDPYGAGEEVSLDQARSRVEYEFYPPETAQASDGSIRHVWLGSEPSGGKTMLPAQSQTTVALAYASGIQVNVVPWVYGRDAPGFSQERNAAAYEKAASQGIGIDVAQIDAIPVRSEKGNGSSPGWVEVNLGTTNADALDISVIGTVPLSDLYDVAGSIIEQWLADHPS